MSHTNLVSFLLYVALGLQQPIAAVKEWKYMEHRGKIQTKKVNTTNQNIGLMTDIWNRA